VTPALWILVVAVVAWQLGLGLLLWSLNRTVATLHTALDYQQLTIDTQQESIDLLSSRIFPPPPEYTRQADWS
jgi:hypothetical protein